MNGGKNGSIYVTISSSKDGTWRDNIPLNRIHTLTCIPINNKQTLKPVLLLADRAVL